MKIIHLVLLFIVFSISSANGAQEQDSNIRNYVDDLVNRSYKIINDKSLSGDEKVTRSRSLVKDNLHLDWMAKYVLGRNKRSLSAAKIKEFADVYSKFVVSAYAELVRDYSGEKTNIKNIKKVDEYMYVVEMEIVKPDSPDRIKVEYLVHKVEGATKGIYKIADIITEGVSILNSQQAEFNSIISAQGIDGLIADLKNKANSKQQKPKA